MRRILESRNEFNSTMNPYTAMIIQTEHFPFIDEFFSSMKLILPTKRILYTPPSWVGASYSPDFMATYKTQDKPKRLRDEEIPELNHQGRYLLCDDYLCTGETFEIAMVRLIERGVNLNNIWGITMGNAETKEASLEKGIEWHKYRLRQKDSLSRTILHEMGFAFPTLSISS